MSDIDQIIEGVKEADLVGRMICAGQAMLIIAELEAVREGRKIWRDDAQDLVSEVERLKAELGQYWDMINKHAETTAELSKAQEKLTKANATIQTLLGAMKPVAESYGAIEGSKPLGIFLKFQEVYTKHSTDTEVKE